MTAGARFGVLGGVAAVIAALFWGAWTVRGVPPSEGLASGDAPAAAEGGATEGAAGGEVAAEAEAGAEAGAEASADAGAAGGAAEGADASVEDGAVVTEGEASEGEAATEDAAGEAVASGEDAAAAEDGAVVEGEAAAEDGVAGEEVASAEDATGDAAAEAVAEAAPDVVAPEPPAFDLVRVERDGAALVAGKAAPQAMLSLRVTGNEIALVPADGQGNFVAMFNLAPSNAPRVLSLVMRMQDGTEVPAEGSVVIAPTVAPAAVAAVGDGAAEGASEGTATASEEAAPVAEAPAALLVTDEGAKVLQTADELPAELVANVTIDTITYTPEGAVQLAGRGTAERVVRLYLDNTQVGGDVSISAAGDWAVTLPDVQPGIYTLRADQIDAEGKVTSRFETPFKRETVEALAAAAGAAADEAATFAAAAEGTGGEAAATSEADGAATEAAVDAAPLTVTVQPGFTLWKIATDTLGEGIRYVQVFEANRDQIRDPDLIYPGQVFTIPEGE